MNENQFKRIVEEAIAPLKTEIETLKAQLAPLLAMMKPKTIPAAVLEAQQILKTIPAEVLQALQVTNVGFDPSMIWFKLLRANGSTISVKKNGTDFRVRVRAGGKLAKELNSPLNGLVGALKKLV